MTETIEDKIRDILLAEIQRQVGSATLGEDGTVQVNGKLNLDDMALAVAGAVAGGP